MNINNIHDTYYLITAISAVVILILGFLLASIRLPKDLPSQKFNTARKYLSFSYLILGVSGVITSISPMASANTQILLLVTAIVASFQSLLFTATHIVFIQPDKAQRKYIVGHLLGITCTSVILSVAFIFNILSDIVLCCAILICYFAQQIYYVLTFRRMHHECVRLMEQYYDEDQDARLRSVNYSFYGALCIGIMSIIAAVTNVYVYIVFIILYTMFYTYMVVLVYNNKLITKVIHPAVINSQLETPEVEETVDSNENVAEPDADEKEEERANRIFKEKLESWISEKGYMQKDLCVDDIVETFGVNREYLRYFFRTYVHSDFRTWRAELRIREAKKLMLKYPEYNFSKISEMVGFNHRANFFNQFVKIEGMSPSEWREKHQND